MTLFHRLRGLGRKISVIAGVLILGGCAGVSKQLHIKETAAGIEPDTIVSGSTGKTVSFDEMMADLSQARIVYVGEQHTHPYHHAIQLRVIKGLLIHHPDLTVGMEMFDVTYQSVLDDWSAGRLDEQAFLKKVHWYANWRYDYDLYRDILRTVQDHHIRVIALNIPFHLPAKIAIGGIESLAAEDKRFLPQRIDTTRQDHRTYVKSIFQRHRIKGREDFESFYEAQCVWEDAMAEAVARHYGGSQMVVLAGNGHIYQKFGIPDRVFERTGAPFRTLYPTAVGGKAALSDGDYIWATPAVGPRHRFK